ncbi:MAG: hypothetical protein K2J90_04635 [Lachnospiraceae bacterium]|nr:hypothetical protein [Lachnospiraceae bacterium]
MEYQIINKITIADKIMDKDKFFSIGYNHEMNIYIMAVEVTWIAWYQRYYAITQEDYMLYQTDRERYYSKYSKEIEQKQACFTERFIGAGALRDYDGAKGFQRTYESSDINPFSGYLYYHGVLYARILWKLKEIYVPPVQVVNVNKEEQYFPLRKFCKLEKNENGIPICYRLDI